MRRGWSSFADTRKKTHPTSSIRTRVFSRFSRQCVGGDVHPVGVRRHLNDSPIFGTRLVVPFSSARAETRFDGGWRLWSLRNQPASAPRTRTSATHGFARGFLWIFTAKPDASFGGRDQIRGHDGSLPEPPRGGCECFCVFRGGCRRRCPSRQRQQAPQRTSGFERRKWILGRTEDDRGFCRERDVFRADRFSRVDTRVEFSRFAWNEGVIFKRKAG
jgi:hypothetical protein